MEEKPRPSDLRVVALSSKAGGGKDYLAREAVVPLGFVPVSFATPIKGRGVAQEGFSEREVLGLVDRPRTCRRFLQEEGERYREKFGERSWQRRLMVRMLRLADHGFYRLVITDLRKPAEAAFVKDLDGVLIRLVGRGGLEGAAGEHATETALDDYDGWDHVVENSAGRGQVAVEEVKSAVLARFGLAWGFPPRDREKDCYRYDPDADAKYPLGHPRYNPDEEAESL